MTLTIAQRLSRLQVRSAELVLWRDRARLPVDGWLFDGAPMALGARWPRDDGVAHFAARALVPADWPLDETRLQLDVGGESLLSLQGDGGAVMRFGLDPFHREFRLPGRRFAIEVESVARLPFGVPNREPRLAEAALVWLDVPVHQLHLLLVQVAEAVHALAGHEVVPHLLAAGEAALRGLDWPSSTQAYVARTSRALLQQKIWQLPPLLDAPPGLNDDERASVLQAHAALVARLRELQSTYPPQGELALTGHAHVDLAWLWPYDETRRKLRRTFHTALSLLSSSQDFRFNQSSAHYHAQIEQDDPALFARIAEQVQAGRWEPIGGMWVEPDTNMPTGESLVRQILYGQRWFEQAFGKRHTVCWLPDCFGFSPALPQLLRQGGMRSFFTIKVNWSETNRLPSDLFWWEGLDGSRVLAHSFDNPMQGYNGFVRADCFVPTWNNFRAKALHGCSLLSVGHGDGGGGATPEMIERELQLRDFPALPRARWSRVDAFFDAAHRTASHATLPVWSGEIYLELHRATLTTQSTVKRLHRQAERALISAETLAGLAHLLGAPAPKNLEPAWRLLMKNQFHDILPGSSIREVNLAAEGELSELLQQARAEQADVMNAIAERMAAGDIEDALVVVNPSLEERLLRLGADEHRVATDDVVPPLSIVVLDRARLAPAPGLSASRERLENRHLRATFDANGSLNSLVLKASGREALAGAGNQLWAYPVDKPRDYDAWDIEPDYAERGERLGAPERIELLDPGPHRASIRVTHRYRASRIEQVYALSANGRRLDIETRIDWHDRRVLLRSLTPVAVRAGSASFECAYGVVQRPTHRNTSWDAAMFEAVAHRFIDLSEPGFGVALLNDAKYGHSVHGNLLGISLVRAPIYPDPLADEGLQQFSYALMPHAGAWFEGGVREEAEDLNQPLLSIAAQRLGAGVVTPIRFGGTEVALSALKRAEDGDGLILRVYEPAGRRGKLVFELPDAWRKVEPVNLLEEAAVREPGPDIRPFEVRSWRVRR